jgi:hypothetical protein
MEKGVERTSEVTKDNPAIALRPQLHRQIRNLRAPQLEGLSPNEVLQRHLDQMKGFTPDYVLRTLEAESQGYIARTFAEPPQAQAEIPVPVAQAETTAPETNVSEEPPQGQLRIENGQLINYDAPQAQAETIAPETTAAETNVLEEPPQERLRIENGELVNDDAPRLRVETTPKRIRVEPEPGDYPEPEEQSSEPPLKKRFLRRDLE